MRTTLRIDDDLLNRLKSRAESEGISMTRLVNRVIRAGLASSDRVADEPAYAEETFDMGEPAIDLTRARTLAAMLEDEEIIGKLHLNK